MANNLEQQRIADQFNVAISQKKQENMVERDGKLVETQPDIRRAALYALQRFEAAGWYPQALPQALGESSDLIVIYADGNPNPDIADIREIRGTLDAMREVLERYIEIVEEKTGAPAIENEYFSARQASWYVARQLTKRGTPMTFAGIDKHIRVNKDLRGQMVGTSMLFTRKQLDDYVDNFDKLPKRGQYIREATPEK